MIYAENVVKILVVLAMMLTLTPALLQTPRPGIASLSFKVFWIAFDCFSYQFESLKHIVIVCVCACVCVCVCVCVFLLTEQNIKFNARDLISGAMLEKIFCVKYLRRQVI